MFELELGILREEGPEFQDERLVYDEENEVFRFREDGVFAFSREFANWKELERRGFGP